MAAKKSTPLHALPHASQQRRNPNRGAGKGAKAEAERVAGEVLEAPTPKMAFQYNTVLNADNFGDCGRRKAWEIMMALRTLEDFGVAGEDKLVLGVGAGTEATIYHLTAKVGQVVATDLYADAGMWAGHAPKAMLDDPGRFAPEGIVWDAERLVVQHADMRALPFDDMTFDAVFSSGSIEHVGSFDDVAVAASEIGRVLKVGGIATISTEFKAWGKGYGWPGVLLFTKDRLYDYLIDPSGLTPVDEPYLYVHEDTIHNPPSLERMVNGFVPEIEMAVRSETHGYIFTSVHLALRKYA